jgi:hypothetical protein
MPEEHHIINFILCNIPRPLLLCKYLLRIPQSWLIIQWCSFYELQMLLKLTEVTWQTRKDAYSKVLS